MNPEHTTVKRALVTGASGFIGRHLCRYLQQQGVHVRALARQVSNGPWDEQVIAILGEGKLEPELVRDIDTVIHLAGYAHAVDEIDSARIHQQVTVAGTRELLSILDRRRQQLLFVSSVKALPVAPGGEPDSDYGRANREAERLVPDLHKRSGTRTIILRLPLVYGPGVKGNLQRMLGAIARGRFPPLPEFGNRRSMVHVEDVCEAVLQALHKGASGACYTLTDGREYSSREIYLAMRKALGRSPPRWAVPVFIFRLLARIGDAAGALAGRRVGFDSQALDKLAGDALYDNGPAIADFQFRPRHCLASALPEMVDAWRAGDPQ